MIGKSKRNIKIIYVTVLLCFCMWCGNGIQANATVSGNADTNTNNTDTNNTGTDNTGTDNTGADNTDGDDQMQEVPASTTPVTYSAGITFGSASYSWNAGEESQIGVYARSSAIISSYEICLEYDSTMLQYISGASEEDGNLLYVRGTGSATSHNQMLQFLPLQGGETTITVVSAVCMYGSGGSARSMTISQMGAAPIVIEEPISRKVTDLQVSPISLDFSAEVYEYHLEVETDIEALTVVYTLENEEAVASLSDTNLVIGENIITLSVKGSAVTPLVYTIYVLRKEVIVPESIEESEEPSQETSEEVLEVTGNTGVQSSRADILLWSGILMLLVIVVTFIIFSYHEAKRRKQEQEEYDSRNVSVINLEETVIDVQNVTMRFRMARENTSSLKEYMIRSLKGQNQYRKLTALKDISFEVKQGEVLGIIGTNGSGKSTLLKIISGVLKPSAGHVETDKDKIQMLTLGTGFDMELTARENVYLNGAIIGYTKEYLDEKFDDIVAFAELDGFMDQRMKNFSSGMVSRLGFAIATMRDAPDILILDEVLSVGDLFFRKKSEKRIRELIHSGATVLIVSHSMDTIRKNCNKVVWIEKGILKMVGNAREVCDAYVNMVGCEE